MVQVYVYVVKKKKVVVFIIIYNPSHIKKYFTFLGVIYCTFSS